MEMDSKYKSYSLNELYAFLKRFHLSKSLHQIACFNEILKFGYTKLKQGHNQPEARAFLGRLSEAQRLEFFLMSTRLARFLILSGANDYRDSVLNIRDGSLQTAINRIGQLSDKEVELTFKDPYDPIVLLGRISHWQFPLQAPHKYTIGRGYLLFHKLLSTTNGDYDINKKMHQYFGIGSYEFLITGFTLWIKSDGLVNSKIPTKSNEMREIISPANQQRFLELSSGSYQSYREHLRGKDWKIMRKMAEVYGLDPFLKMPAILPDRAGLVATGTFIIPQPRFLLDRASTGIFYLLADKEQQLALEANHKGRNPFRRMFGMLYRDYAKMYLCQSHGNSKFIDLDEDFTQIPGLRIPDFALISGNTCLLMEIKTSLLSVSSRTYYELDKLEDEVRTGSLKKALTQLQAFKSRLLAGELNDDRFENVNEVYTVIIGYEDVYVLNGILLPLMRKHYGAEITEGLQLGSISDLEIMGTILQEGGDLVKLMKEKYQDNMRSFYAISVAFENYKKHENKILKTAFDDYMNELKSKFKGEDKI